MHQVVNFVCNVMRNQVLRFLPTFYIWKMPRVSKCKKHLAKIALLVVESKVEGNKCRKDIRQIERNRAFQNVKIRSYSFYIFDDDTKSIDCLHFFEVGKTLIEARNIV